MHFTTYVFERILFVKGRRERGGQEMAQTHGVDRVYGDDGYPTLILVRADELEDVLCAASRRAA